MSIRLAQNDDGQNKYRNPWDHKGHSSSRNSFPFPKEEPDQIGDYKPSRQTQRPTDGWSERPQSWHRGSVNEDTAAPQGSHQSTQQVKTTAAWLSEFVEA